MALLFITNKTLGKIFPTLLRSATTISEKFIGVMGKYIYASIGNENLIQMVLE